MVLAVTAARAAECPGNPDAIGTSRTIAVDPAEHPRVGTMQYSETLPLANKEVVLTFDDGPVPRYSKVVLATLASECVKATYFLVGHMAQVYPETVREMLAGGHTLGTHSQNHPLSFEKMPIERAQVEVEQGIANVGAALGDPQAVAPFFRIPGLLRAERVETYLASRSIMVWSSDVVGDDWKRIAPAEIVRRVMERLEVKGKGIILLHDIHPNTAAALPDLLRELKMHGYRIVHVVPASPSVPEDRDRAAAMGAACSRHAAHLAARARRQHRRPRRPADRGRRRADPREHAWSASRGRARALDGGPGFTRQRLAGRSARNRFRCHRAAGPAVSPLRVPRRDPRDRRQVHAGRPGAGRQGHGTRRAGSARRRPAADAPVGYRRASAGWLPLNHPFAAAAAK